MSMHETECTLGNGAAAGDKNDESELAQVLMQSYWDKEQAKRVLLAQKKSGQSICQFAKKWGLSPRRLYYWRDQLGPQLLPVDSVSVSGDMPGNPLSMLQRELDLNDPGQRQAYEYVERATSGSQPTWELHNSRREGAMLRLVVRWAQRVCDSEPYSVVEVALTEPYVRWRDFPTLRAAQDALLDRPSSKAAQQDKAALPPLVQVQVRGKTDDSEQGWLPQAEAGSKRSCITFEMPSGVRIRIPAGVPRGLIRTVLRTMRRTPC
jgi:transposase-like protein